MKAVRQVSLIRHPETDWNAARRYQGRTDRPWTREGELQAERLVQRFAGSPFDLVLSSPTAHASKLAERFGPPRIDPRWCEVDHGLWEGLTWDEVGARHGPDHADRYGSPMHSNVHQGETLKEVVRRVESAWMEVVWEHAHQNIVIFTHCTPIQIVLCRANNLPPESFSSFQVAHSSVTLLALQPARPVATPPTRP